MIVVIVGGIGTGKSAVIKVLENLGEKVLSADAINKEFSNMDDFLKMYQESTQG